MPAGRMTRSFTARKPKKNLTKKVNKLAKKVKENEAAFTLGNLDVPNNDIFTTPTVLTLQTVTNPPSTNESNKYMLKTISYKGLLDLTVTSHLNWN